MSVVEPYHSERILRQLGHIQSILDPHVRPLEVVQIPYALKYFVEYGSIRQLGVLA
ncbi:hypothetical protein Syun_008665 [Stephania yunnanensis]|uniref:Uncharacterized protein n=1 Tax=Stephania yunnanensis TaxID=152371 RepID=A0AAP0PRK1_9MAGN